MEEVGKYAVSTSIEDGCVYITIINTTSGNIVKRLCSNFNNYDFILKDPNQTIEL